MLCKANRSLSWGNPGMRILFIAMSNSVHTARWISQIADQGWDIHLFPSEDHGVIHPDLRDITVHQFIYSYFLGRRNPKLKYKGIPLVTSPMVYIGRYLLKKFLPDYQKIHLRHTIQKLRPDIIHSLEFQSAGYLTSEVRNRMNRHFTPWIATNWGSDIYLFGRLLDHQGRIKEVLSSCDYYSCECQRDVDLALSMGLKGKVLPVLPNAGGYDLKRISGLFLPTPPSSRKIILLKGYQGWFGRALVGLRAIGMSSDCLKGYRVVIYSAWKDTSVKIAAELLQRDTGLPVEVLSQCTHDEMLRLFGQARIYLGLSISDAISTSLLEAMVMGAFPIQSNTSSADEWITDGKTGFIVPPEDPESVAQAIRRAIMEDDLVDNAAQINAQTARERLDVSIVKPQVIAMYSRIYAESQRRGPA
jgi:glycosyltransferase involved in cell wall biosynthesis